MRQLPFEYAFRNLGRSRSRLLAALIGSSLVALLSSSAQISCRFPVAASIRTTGWDGSKALLICPSGTIPDWSNAT